MLVELGIGTETEATGSACVMEKPPLFLSTIGFGGALTFRKQPRDFNVPSMIRMYADEFGCAP